MNTTAQLFDAAGWRMSQSELAAALDDLPLGGDTADLETMPQGTLFMNAGTEAGSESAALRDLVPGTFLIDCLSYGDDGDSHNHVYRADTTVEVVAP